MVTQAFSILIAIFIKMFWLKQMPSTVLRRYYLNITVVVHQTNDCLRFHLDHRIVCRTYVLMKRQHQCINVAHMDRVIFSAKIVTEAVEIIQKAQEMKQSNYSKKGMALIRLLTYRYSLMRLTSLETKPIYIPRYKV